LSEFSAFTQLNVNVVLLGFAGKCVADKMESDLASSKPCCCSHWESILHTKLKTYTKIFFKGTEVQKLPVGSIIWLSNLLRQINDWNIKNLFES
jgi:hypothetical protein